MTLTLGQAVRLIREHATESQVTFARAIGVTNVYLSYVENDRSYPSARVVKEVQRVYGYDPHLLVALARETQGQLRPLASHRALLTGDAS